MLSSVQNFFLSEQRKAPRQGEPGLEGGKTELNEVLGSGMARMTTEVPKLGYSK